jgi:hypothetical protein
MTNTNPQLNCSYCSKENVQTVEEGSPEEDVSLLFGNNRSKVKANMAVVLLVPVVKSRWKIQAEHKYHEPK